MYSNFRDFEAITSEENIFEAEKQIESVLENPETAKQLSIETKRILIFIILNMIIPFFVSIGASIAYNAWENSYNLQHQHSSINVKEIAQNLKSEVADEILSYHRLVTVDNLRLREFPNKKSETISLLPKGVLLRIIDKENRSWLEVEVQIDDELYTGWVFRRYTKYLH